MAAILFSLASSVAQKQESPDCQMCEVAYTAAFEILTKAEEYIAQLHSRDELVPPAQFTAQLLELLESVKESKARVEPPTADRPPSKTAAARAALTSLESIGDDVEFMSPEEHLRIGHMFYLRGDLESSIAHYQQAGDLGSLSLLLVLLEAMKFKDAIMLADSQVHSDGSVNGDKTTLMMAALFMASYSLGPPAVLCTYPPPYSQQLTELLLSDKASELIGMPTDMNNIPMSRDKVSTAVSSINGMWAWTPKKIQLYCLTSGLNNLSITLLSRSGHWSTVCFLPSSFSFFIQMTFFINH